MNRRWIMKLKRLLFLTLTAGFMGCSNAPPNFYALGNSSDNRSQLIGSGRLVLPIEPVFNQYDDTAEVMRSDGSEGNPSWGNFVDYFTFSYDLKHGAFHFGPYTSNFYPGIYVGIRNDRFGAALFTSSAVPSLKIMPGLQLNANFKALNISYSLYQENLGSVLLLPWFGEPGPTKKVISEKYVFGIKIFNQLGILAFVNRSYWRNVRSTGLELYFNNAFLSK